jgi:hypothetical protein
MQHTHHKLWLGALLACVAVTTLALPAYAGVRVSLGSGVPAYPAPVVVAPAPVVVAPPPAVVYPGPVIVTRPWSWLHHRWCIGVPGSSLADTTDTGIATGDTLTPTGTAGNDTELKRGPSLSH